MPSQVAERTKRLAISMPLITLRANSIDIRFPSTQVKRSAWISEMTKDEFSSGNAAPKPLGPGCRRSRRAGFGPKGWPRKLHESARPGTAGVHAGCGEGVHALTVRTPTRTGDANVPGTAGPKTGGTFPRGSERVPARTAGRACFPWQWRLCAAIARFPGSLLSSKSSETGGVKLRP